MQKNRSQSIRCVVCRLHLAIKNDLKQLHCEKLLATTRHIVVKLCSPSILSLQNQNLTWPHVGIQRIEQSRVSWNYENRSKNYVCLYLSFTSHSRYGPTWEELFSVIETPYSAALKLRAENLTSGVFMKEWRSLKHTLRTKEIRLALEILKSMEKQEISAFQSRFFLTGVCVDVKYRILLSNSAGLMKFLIPQD